MLQNLSSAAVVIGALRVNNALYSGDFPIYVYIDTKSKGLPILHFKGVTGGRF